MKIQIRRRLVLVVASAALSSAAARAAEPTAPAPADPSPAQRHEMAELHQRMAECLLSVRPMAECRAEMQQGGRGMEGASGCTMMGGGGMQGPSTGASQKAPDAETPSGAHEEHGH